MTNFKQLSASFPADTSSISKSNGEWVNLYTRAHRRREKCMRDAEVLRVNVLKQQENDLEKYRRELITGGPGKTRVDSLMVSKTPAAFKPSTNNSRTAMTKISLYPPSPSLSPSARASVHLKWPSSVPPRLRNSGQTSPRRKKAPTKLPPLRGTLETNYINIARKYANDALRDQTDDRTTVQYRLPRQEWTPADSTPKDLEGNPSRLSELSKIWEQGTCIYCELERIERSIPRPPRVFKWRSMRRNGGDVNGGDGGVREAGVGVDRQSDDYGGGDGGDRSKRDYDGNKKDEVGDGDAVDEINEVIKANAVRLDDRPCGEFALCTDVISSSDDSSITGDFPETNERIKECVPPESWDDDDVDVEVDYEALERLAKWYERYPSTPVSFWKHEVKRTLPSFFPP